MTRPLFREAVDVMVAGFRRLEQQVPKPVVVPFRDGEALRYAERTIHQALVQKLARYVSGLNAIDTLLLAGYVQEQAVIQRTLDEIGEDITFLVLGINNGETALHRDYLKVFWQEEFEEGIAPIDNTKGRYNIARRKIRLAIEGVMGAQPGSPEVKAGSVISQVYSGYVHAASPHVMEMCGGEERRFFVTGLKGTSRMREHVQDAWNYSYRGLLALTMVAKAFGDGPLVDQFYAYLARFEEASGTAYIAEVRARYGPGSF